MMLPALGLTATAGPEPLWWREAGQSGQYSQLMVAVLLLLEEEMAEEESEECRWLAGAVRKNFGRLLSFCCAGSHYCRLHKMKCRIILKRNTAACFILNHGTIYIANDAILSLTTLLNHWPFETFLRHQTNFWALRLFWFANLGWTDLLDSTGHIINPH